MCSTEFEVGAELRAEAQCREGPTDRLRLGLFKVVTERLGVFAAPARRRAAIRQGDLGPEHGFASLMGDDFGIDLGVGMLGSQPDEPPLDLEIFVSIDQRKVSRWVECPDFGHLFVAFLRTDVLIRV